MKTIAKNFRIITYGQSFSKATTLRDVFEGVPWCKRWRSLSKRAKDISEYLLVSSQDIDDAFADEFRENATQATRLLVFLNEGASTDRLLSRLVDLSIRTPQRFYLADSCGSGKTHGSVMVESLLARLASALKADDHQTRILDAKIEDGVLRAISPDFNRMDVPISQIPTLRKASASKVQKFEIDEDGAFIYWPELDVHLGWTQLQQFVDPDAAVKALLKTQAFNVRYGRAVRKLREQAGLKPSDIKGLSDKQLRRIESGESRVTSNAIEALSVAHKLSPNEYMKKLAAALEHPSHS